jgi:hypothetical protein
LEKTCVVSEFLNCIHIALLCVQEDPINRPTMSTIVVSHASKWYHDTPNPKQPAFSVGRKNQTLVSAGSYGSVNDMSISSFSPR